MLQKNEIILCLSIFACSAMLTWACSVMRIATPQELVSEARVIVRATAVDYEKPDVWINGVLRSVIRFEIEEQLKGDAEILNDIFISGYLTENDDFNDNPSPYNYVRPDGRAGSCFANNYKQGAEFLLFLNAELTPYWSALAPVNEQLHSPSSSDEWLQWVKRQVALSGANRLKPFFY